jgi:hypothetical protein
MSILERAVRLLDRGTFIDDMLLIYLADDVMDGAAREHGGGDPAARCVANYLVIGR